MYPPITYSLLVEKKACQPQLDLFEKHFGKTKAIPLTKKVVTKFSSVFDIDWAADRLLTKEDYKEYNKVQAPALEEYKKVNSQALEEYKKVNSQALEEYNKVKAPAFEEYNKVKAPALEEYKKVTALAFVEIYKKGMKKA
jgi:hypothetical protein